jgi:hypothetical protein
MGEYKINQWNEYTSIPQWDNPDAIYPWEPTPKKSPFPHPMKGPSADELAKFLEDMEKLAETEKKKKKAKPKPKPKPKAKKQKKQKLEPAPTHQDDTIEERQV